jgi:hypothetical protein
MAIKFEYGVKKNWTGDPCFPTIYAWDGVECSNTSGKTTRITSLWVSKSISFRFLVFLFLQVLVVQFIIGASDLNVGLQIAMQRPLKEQLAWCLIYKFFKAYGAREFVSATWPAHALGPLQFLSEI